VLQNKIKNSLKLILNKEDKSISTNKHRHYNNIVRKSNIVSFYPECPDGESSFKV
jgi:hypothetical protein